MPHNIMSASQLAATKYDVPQSDVGSHFAINRYQGQSDTPMPYMTGTNTTSAKGMAWKNLSPGAKGGTLQSFADSGAAPMPESIGG